ncbi:hypothetical protein [Corynebacterium uterequi]|uniref:Uncharacterized protein n=1 Tax=Corynebacterium uterequi TaxID=1072256 RepID=A0A0G3HA69_9CORY|nr:hypothetical protein [Corynebacterium uterequi]AKK10209.1 hypothetical protein CUTER_00940 [Corynebacterium uterequi]
MMSASEFVTRSREGAAALTAALTRPDARVERLVFAAAHDAAVTAEVIGSPKAVTAASVLRPAAFAALAVTAARDMLRVGRRGGEAVALSVLMAAGEGSVAARTASYALLTPALTAQAAQPSRWPGLLPSGASAGVSAVVLAAGWRRHELTPTAIAAEAAAGLARAWALTAANNDALRAGAVPAKGISHGVNMIAAAEAGEACLRAAGGSAWVTRVASACLFSARALGVVLVTDGLTRGEASEQEV